MQLYRVALKCRETRVKRQLTLEKLGELAGLSRSTIWEFENGSDVQFTTLERITEALGLTLTITEKL